MHVPSDEQFRTLEGYLAALRRRAFLLRATESVLAAGAATAFLLALIALLSEPVVTPTWSAATWILCASAPAAIIVSTMLQLRGLMGAGAVNLLAHRAPRLSPRLRSALELATAVAPRHSTSLASAHVAAITEQIANHPPKRVVPAGAVVGRKTAASGAILVSCGLLLSLHPDLRAGLAALRYPAVVGESGVLTAAVVEDIEAQLLFPSYLDRPPTTLTDPEDLIAPVGTTVELTLHSRMEVSQALLQLPDHEAALTQDGDIFRGRFVVRHSGPLRLRVRRQGQLYEDSKARTVTAVADDVPLVELITPLADTVVDPGAPLQVSFRAQDDKGLEAVELALQLPGQTVFRRTLWSAQQAGRPEQTLEAKADFVPASLGIRAGDRFELWLEARDGDAVSGPNLGSSARLGLQALSAAQHLSEHLPKLGAVLDVGIIALAERLETAVPKRFTHDLQHFRRVQRAGDRFVKAIKRLLNDLDEQGVHSPGFDRTQLHAMGERVDRKQRREAALYQQSHPARDPILRLDTLLVEEMEADVLLLSDLLSQAHVDEAKALSDELSELRKRMHQLLDELSESESESARRQLLAELARAENRLRELKRSMTQLAAHVPGEFINREALQGQPTGSTMQDLRHSIETGDMDAATEHLANLERQLQALSKSLEEGGLRFREARFGPRDKALMEAQERLAVLADEQGRLARYSAERTRQILDRAPTAGDGADQRLGEGARRLQQQLSQLDESAMGESERAMLDRADQRVRDTMDSLRTGDMSEAARMASAGGRAIERMARNLATDAQMFPGHDGRMAENASAAETASASMQRLSEQIGRALPRLSDHIQREDLRKMQQQASEQRRARKAAEALREHFESGPNGLPLAPEAGEVLDHAQRAMRRAEQQLQRGDLQSAGLSQEEATEQLRGLGERLAEKQAARDASAQQGLSNDMRSRVNIPDSEDFEAPTELRRRLLDAMREGGPPGYEAAVARYYQELLR